MPNINRAQVLGYAGRDAQLRNVANDKALASFSLGTSEKDKQGGVKHTEWHKIDAWGHAAEVASQVKKGDLVYVEGKLRTREWTDKEGNKRTTTAINAFLVIVCVKGSPVPKQAELAAKEEEIPF